MIFFFLRYHNILWHVGLPITSFCEETMHEVFKKFVWLIYRFIYYCKAVFSKIFAKNKIIDSALSSRYHCLCCRYDNIRTVIASFNYSLKNVTKAITYNSLMFCHKILLQQKLLIEVRQGLWGAYIAIDGYCCDNIGTINASLKGLSHQIFKALLWPTISNLYFLRGRWWFLNFFI
jgi:hypothetical protein